MAPDYHRTRISLGAPVASTSPDSLPGAAGTPVVIVNTPASPSILIEDVFMSNDCLDCLPIVPTVFPSGVESL